MKILYIGGYGNISWHCTQKTLELGHDTYVLNRDLRTGTRKEIPQGAKLLRADIRDTGAVVKVLQEHSFDVVCDFLCFTPEHAQKALDVFHNKTQQYIFISTDTVYKKADEDGFFRETSCKYALGDGSVYVDEKLQTEAIFMQAFTQQAFPITIVRPGYTYDTIIPHSIGHNCFTTVQRCLDGKPLLIAGPGDNRWTFTHAKDFAHAFVELFGKKECLGEDYLLTADSVDSFNNVMKKILYTLGLRKVNIIHVPLEDMQKHKELLPHDIVFRCEDRLYDTSKIKKIAPHWKTQVDIATGIQETIAWFNENNKRKRYVASLDEQLEKLTSEYAAYQKEVALHE